MYISARAISLAERPQRGHVGYQLALELILSTIGRG